MMMFIEAMFTPVGLVFVLLSVMLVILEIVSRLEEGRRRTNNRCRKIRSRGRK